MTAAEKAALDWLDKWAAHEPPISAHRHIATLKAMLAQPRLPAEPSPEILKALMEGWLVETPYTVKALTRSYRALHAHLTKPKTKTFWVVHVSHGPNDDGGTLESEDAAIEYARGFMSLPGATVTISTREVPA